MADYDITIIIPVFNNEDDLPATLKELDEALSGSDLRAELLFVDDASKDNSARILSEFKAGRENVKILRMARNYGVETVEKAGFEHSSADIVITLEAHLQHEASEIFRFHGMVRDGADVVCARRTGRADPLWRRLCSRIMNLFLRAACGMPVTDMNCMLKAWRKEAALDAFADPGSYAHFFSVMRKLKVVEVPVSFGRARAGRSSFTPAVLLRTAAKIIKGAAGMRSGPRVSGDLPADRCYQLADPEHFPPGF